MRVELANDIPEKKIGDISEINESPEKQPPSLSDD